MLCPKLEAGGAYVMCIAKKESLMYYSFTLAALQSKVDTRFPTENSSANIQIGGGWKAKAT